MRWDAKVSEDAAAYIRNLKSCKLSMADVQGNGAGSVAIGIWYM
jgi:hypothetical protein